MTSGSTRKAITGLLLASVGLAMVPVTASAQEDANARIRRLESEIRALQRVVFPGGDGRYFTPEVDTSANPQQTQAVNPPANSALTDMLARLDALEAQLARLTARGEENANELAQLKAQLAEAQAAAAPPQVDPAAIPPSQGLAANSASSPPVTVRNIAAPTPTPASAIRPAPTPTPTPAPAPARPTAARLAAVQAVAKPQTDDAGDDEYTYGFRLWEAELYPEAQQQLALFLERYPRHARASFGRNLLGRAYLDNRQFDEAAVQFYENYCGPREGGQCRGDKQAPRAADSLLFLVDTMIAKGDNNRACIALAEFGETYPALATGRLKDQYERNRGRIRCTA